MILRLTLLPFLWSVILFWEMANQTEHFQNPSLLSTWSYELGLAASTWLIFSPLVFWLWAKRTERTSRRQAELIAANQAKLKSAKEAALKMYLLGDSPPPPKPSRKGVGGRPRKVIDWDQIQVTTKPYGSKCTLH